MINYKVRTDKYGNELIDYFVLMGDTFPMEISLTSADTPIINEIVETVLFKQSDDNYNEVYSTEFTYDDRSSVWKMEIPHETTSSFDPELTYIYEIEVTLKDGTKTTPTQAKIKYLREIVKSNTVLS